MSLAELWQRMEQRPVPAQVGVMQHGAYTGSGCAVMAGLRFPGAVRLLMVRLPDQEATALVSSGLTTAIDLMLESDHASHPGQSTVYLQTADVLYLDLFTHIGDDLVTVLKNDPVRPVQALLERMELWRAFFRRREGALSEPQVRGIFGEVWYLYDQLIPRTAPCNHVAAIAAWTGPLGAACDFHLGAAALDMKTGTLAARTVEISSLQQLTPPSGTRLYLGHLTLRRDGAGQSLPELVGCLREAINEEARDLLSARLLSAGYIDADRDILDRLRFLPHVFTTFEVTAEFPALTPQTVPLGVVACTYTVDLSACMAFQVDPATIPGIGEIRQRDHEQ